MARTIRKKASIPVPDKSTLSEKIAAEWEPMTRVDWPTKVDLTGLPKLIDRPFRADQDEGRFVAKIDNTRRIECVSKDISDISADAVIFWVDNPGGAWGRNANKIKEAETAAIQDAKNREVREAELLLSQTSKRRDAQAAESRLETAQERAGLDNEEWKMQVGPVLIGLSGLSTKAKNVFIASPTATARDGFRGERENYVDAMVEEAMALATKNQWSHVVFQLPTSSLGGDEIFDDDVRLITNSIAKGLKENKSVTRATIVFRNKEKLDRSLDW
ncbi:MAG: hypothetical protein ABH950_09710 [Candidatus Altiarchaeota archaeon]